MLVYPESECQWTNDEKDKLLLTQMNARFGDELGNAAFFALFRLATLPYTVQVFANLPQEALIHTAKESRVLLAMIFDQERHSELAKVVGMANKAHLAHEIPSEQVSIGAAIIFVSTYDWLNMNASLLSKNDENVLMKVASWFAKQMELDEFPRTIDACREFCDSHCTSEYSPEARDALFTLIKVYRGLWGWRRLFLVLILFPASLPLRFHSVFGIPRLPGLIYRVATKTIFAGQRISSFYFAKRV